MEWDLSVIFSSRKAIEKEVKLVGKLADKIKAYRGTITKMGARKIKFLLEEYEEFALRMNNLELYPGLRVEANAGDKEANELYNSITQSTTNWRKDTAFINLELGKALNSKPNLITTKILSDRIFYLTRLKENFQYKLSELEEVLILEKDRNGAYEWAKLQGELLGKSKFKVIINGKEEDHNWNSAYGYITSEDHNERKAGIVGLGEGLAKKADIYAFAFRNLASNYITESKRRGYPNYLIPSLFDAHLSTEIIDVMFDVLIENKELFQEFLTIKANLLGTDVLRGEDIEAPFPFSSNQKITWDEAKNIVIEGFTDFDPEFGKIAADMFEKDRVDALNREGKSSGAFCATWHNGGSTFIKMGYNDNMDSVGTLAHEMGHAVHGYLNVANQPYLNRLIGMPIAETASEFGSLLFNLKFMNEAKNETERKTVLFNMVQNFMIVIFEVGSRKIFEDKVYEALDNNEYLDVEKINTLFWDARKTIFGEAIEWLPEQAYHWCWKPHYYDPRFRYYNYPYIFGEFSVLSMYASYREDPKAFTANFKDFLKAGASAHPQKMFQDLFGFDLTSKSFWQAGMDELKVFVDKCKEYLD